MYKYEGGLGKIVIGINECSHGDEILARFLRTILYEESESSNNMLDLKNKYKKKIEEALKEWSEAHEA